MYLPVPATFYYTKVVYQLVIDKLLSLLPRRQTDSAIIIRCQDSGEAKSRVFKLNGSSMDPILLERKGGYERQYRFACPRCALPVAYQTNPPPAKSGEFLYILPGALTQVQGQVPSDAFELGRGESIELESAA